VSSFIDTNVLVRHLVGDPPDMARRATAFLATEKLLFLADLIVAETVYVLESFYEIDRSRIAEAMRSLLAMESVQVIDAPLLLRAIALYEDQRLDFADAYLVACAEITGVTRVASFDKAIGRIPTVERIEP
jgi:predicted nucleic-acid-binding protein